MKRVGLIGFGMGCRVFHAPLVSSVPGLELAAVLERSSNKAIERYPSIRTVRTLDELLADASLDLIVISTPSATHFDLARQVITAGKHLIVDKPLCTSSTEIATLIELARQHGVLLAPFHNRRWDGDFLTVRKLIADGTLGRLVHFESRFDRWRPHLPTERLWKEDVTSGGILLDLGTHIVDQIVELFGLPLAVAADIQRERPGDGANDSMEVRLRYDGFIATAGANMLSLPARPRFELRGTRGNYIKHGLDPQEAALGRITRIDDPRWGQDTPANWGHVHVDIDGGTAELPLETIAGDYRSYYRGVLGALNGTEPMPVQPHSAWRVARLLEWAIESAQDRREIPCDWSGEPKA